MSSEIVSQQPGGLALPADMMAALAAEAKEVAAKERPAVARISLRSGIMSYQGNEMAGNKMQAVILASAFKNVLYTGAFDPDNIVSPDCFAFAENEEDLVPSANVREPRNATCAGCRMLEWGTGKKSDGSPSRGKACKETRRLIVMPWTAVDAALTKGPDEILKSELAILDVPVTSVQNYSTFVNVLATTANVPPYAAMAEIMVVPDRKTQFQVKFQPMRTLPNMEILQAVKRRVEDARKLVLEPYEESGAPVDKNDKVIPADQRQAKPAKAKF